MDIPTLNERTEINRRRLRTVILKAAVLDQENPDDLKKLEEIIDRLAVTFDQHGFFVAYVGD